MGADARVQFGGGGVDTAALAARHVLHPWAVQREVQPAVTVTGGEGVYFFDDRGNRYLDFSSQLFNVNLGHNHPQLIAAIQQQAAKLSYIAPQYATEPMVELARRLAEVTPGDLTATFFTSSGSTANEMAVMIARLVTGRQKVIARYRSYHGSTGLALALSGDPRRAALGHSLDGIVRIHDPYCYRCPFGLTYPDCGVQCGARHIEETIRLEGPEQIAAIILEPVTGSNGCMVPPREYWQQVRELCDRYGILLIADEVITGFGRTGQWFGVDGFGVVPDILTFAKGVNSGYVPLGGCIVSAAIAAELQDRLLPIGFTYSGHALACAAGVAALDVYRRERVLENVRAQERYLKERFGELADRHLCVGDIRGCGLLWCIELVRDRSSREALVPWGAASALTTQIKQALWQRGVSAFVRWNFLFVAPPLIIRQAELDAGLAAIDEVLGAIDRGELAA
ncbi:MAG TPA: aminotransferase class III-fold pyridoxal phosphate-dependent enzyme [Bacillota bacterium]